MNNHILSRKTLILVIAIVFAACSINQTFAQMVNFNFLQTSKDDGFSTFSIAITGSTAGQQTSKFSFALPDSIDPANLQGPYPYIESCTLDSAPVILTQSTSTFSIRAGEAPITAVIWTYTSNIATGDHTIQCTYFTPFPTLVQLAYDHELLLTEYFISHSLSSYNSLDIFPSTVTVDAGATVGKLSISNIYGFSGVNIGQWLRIGLSCPSAVTINAVHSFQNQTLQQSVDFIWDSGSGAIHFTDGIPQDTIALMIDFTGNNDFATTAQCDLRFFIAKSITGVDIFTPLIEANTSTLLVPNNAGTAQFNPYVHVTVQSDQPWQSLVTMTYDKFTHGTFTLEIKFPLVNQVGQVLKIEVPSLYRRYTSLAQCFSDPYSANRYVHPSGSYVTFTPTTVPQNGLITLTCYGFISQFAPQYVTSAGYNFNYIDFKVSLTLPQNNNAVVYMVPWVISQTPTTIHTIASIASKSYLNVSPAQYGIPLSSEMTWILGSRTSGGFMRLDHSLYEIDVTLNTHGTDLNPTMFNVEAHAAVYDSRTDGIAPQSCTVRDIPAVYNNIDPNHGHFTFTQLPTSQRYLHIDPYYQVGVTIKPFKTPNAVTGNNDFQYFPPGEPYSDELFTVQTYENDFKPIAQFRPHPGHIPSLSLSLAITGSSMTAGSIYNRPVDPTPFGMTATFTFSSKPRDAPADLTSYPLNSVWRLFPTVRIFPSTTMVINFALSGPSGINTPKFLSTFNLNLTPFLFYSFWSFNAGPRQVVSADLTSMSINLVYDEDVPGDITADGLIAVGSSLDTSNDPLFVEMTITKTIKMVNGMFPNPTPTNLAPPQTIFFPFIALPVHYGSMTCEIMQPDGSKVAIQRLMDNGDAQMNTKLVPFLESDLSISTTFTPSAGGFTSFGVGLYYHDRNGQDVLIHDFGKTANGQQIQRFRLPTIKVYINAFFRFTYYYDEKNRYDYSLINDSVYFDTKTLCFIPDSSTTSGFKAKCSGLNDVCVYSTGECVTIEPTPPLSTPTLPSATKCPRCDQSNTSTCTMTGSDDQQCQCKDGWEGKYCKQSKQCDPKKSKCIPENGFVSPVMGSTSSSTCESTCNCYNQWAGLSCQTCQLQCFNDGLRYNDCARCGCQEGYSGKQCECQAAKATLTLNAVNELIIDTLGKLSTDKSNLFQIDFNQIANIADNPNQYPIGSTELDVNLILMFREIFSSFQTPLTTTKGGYFKMTIAPSPLNQLATEFKFTIPFGCVDYNSQITSLEQLKTIWSTFTGSITDNETILKYFSFNSTSQPIISDVEPVEPTLPGDNDALINSGVTKRLSVVIIALLLSLMVTSQF